MIEPISGRKADPEFAAKCRALAKAIHERKAHRIGTCKAIDLTHWDLFGITYWTWGTIEEGINVFANTPAGREHRVMFLLMIAEAEENP